MSVLVFADAAHGKIVKATHEAICYGKAIADKMGSSVTVLTYGNVDQTTLEGLGAFGASKVLVHRGIEHVDDEVMTKLLADTAGSEDAKVIVFAFDTSGKSIAPRLSARLKAGLVAGATTLPEIDGAKFTIKKNVFSGKAIAKFEVETDQKIISLLPNSIPVTNDGGSASVEELSTSVEQGRISVEEFKAEGGDGIPLPEAELVVSAGRGLKGPENWGIVEDLANELGAATACSRPVADIGWRPHHEHVGQTGVAIRPNLYIVAGISGAIQHLAGVNGSKTIVVINTDPEAPFFKAADYGIVGDAFEVLPRLTEAVKKFKSAN